MKEERFLIHDHETREKGSETTQYLENLIRYANAPIIVWDASLRITRFNNAFERLTGRAASEVLGRSPEILFPETRREELMGLIRETTAGERWETVEIPILTAGGRIRTVLWNSAAVYEDDRKTVSSVIAQGQDITERKQAEEALRRLNETLEERVVERTDELAKANAILSTICEHTPAPIYVTDRRSRLVMCNPAVLRTIGRTHPEVLGKSEAELFGPEVGAPIVAHDQRVMETGITETFEEEIGDRIFYMTKTPLRDIQGEITGVIAVGTEITELKRAEAQKQRLLEQLQQSAEEMEVQNEELQCTTEQLQEKTEELALLNRALQESEEHFRSLIENASDIILLLDMQRRITYASPSVKQIGGYEPDNLIGTDVLDLIHPEDVPKAIEAVRTRARPSTSLTFEVRVRDATGRWIFLDVTGTSLIREGGAWAFIVSARDVTDRNHAEEERNRLLASLEEAHREANLYLDIITHDIRNANNVSSIYVDLMIDLLDGTERAYARKLHDSIARSTEILMNVSTIRRIHTDSAEFSPVDLSAVVSEEARNFRGASIRQVVPPLEVLADNLLATIFMNLIGNSVKFGGPEVEIVVRAEELDGEVLVSVEDNGPGVPDDVKGKLFQRFERGKARGRGDGLGLFICRTLIGRYGGRIWIEDRVPGRPEDGAAFRFTLKPATRERDPGRDQRGVARGDN
jgi:PAS domain S-box-containing protein